MNRQMRKDLSQDKKTAGTAVHKHEKAMHPGKALTPMKKGGRACMAAGGGAFSAGPAPKMATKATPAPNRFARPVKATGGAKTLVGDNKMPTRPMNSFGGSKYAEGGVVKKKNPVAPSGSPIKTGPKENMPKARQVFAAGGVAKIRHNQATAAGKPTAGAQKKFGSLI